MATRLIAVVLFVCGCASSQEPVPSGPLLDPSQSAVYMQFIRAGRCPSSVGGHVGERIWLALKNNTRWPVLVTANGVEDECYGDAVPFYSVEANGSMVPDGPIPLGHWFDVASLVEIGPGEALNLSVPKAHLDPGLSIRIDFQFNWEKNNGYTRHSAYFSYWDLPHGLQDKEKEKKLKCVSGSCFRQMVPVKQPDSPEPPALTLPATSIAPPQANQSHRYENELVAYRLFDGAKWGELIPLESTIADVRRVMGAPADPRDIANYTKPYPGDEAAKQPVFSYRINADWEALVYFGRYCERIPRDLRESLASRVCSIELVPLKRCSFRGVTFPPTFHKQHVDAADAGWYEYADGSGLAYEVYTTRTPYGETLPGDLNRVIYGPSVEQIAQHRGAK